MSYNRRDILKTSALASLFLASPAALRAFSQKSEHFTSLRRNIGVYTNRGGTIGWLMNSDSCVVVDAQFPDTAEDCLGGVIQMHNDKQSQIREQNGIAPGNQSDTGTDPDPIIDLLVNTHHHADHTAGNPVFRPKTRHIIAHENVPVLQKEQARMRGNESDNVYADLTFSEQWSGDFGDETVHLRHYGPAHTSGDCIVVFEKANIVHMGDLVFNGVFPFIDVNGGASIKNWIALLETVSDEHNRDTTYIFGHGQPSMGVTGNRDGLHLMRNYLNAVAEHVLDSAAHGHSLDETSAVVSLKGFENFISYGPRLSLAANIEAAWNELVESN